VGKSDRDPLFFPPARQGELDDQPEDQRLQLDPAAQQKGLRLVVFGGLLALAVLLLYLQRDRVSPPRSATETRNPPSAAIPPLGGLAQLSPQQQAERLLERALNHDRDAARAITRNAQAWRGSLQLTSRLDDLLTAASNSPDLGLRAAAIEIQLAAHNIAKSPEAAARLIALAEAGGNPRLWALWMLGMLANRGVEPDRARQTLLAYVHDRNQQTRLWAVEGLAQVGNEDVVSPLLEVLHNDPSFEVRERAARSLGRGGMLSPDLRLHAVPELLRFADNPTLPADTRRLVFQALRDITGQDLANDPAAWRRWQSSQAADR
jgi:hypothetical protein